MQTHKVSLHDVFANRKRFTVPLFQRAYVWSLDRQWHPLWEDLNDLAEDIERASPGLQRPRGHFLGAIVTVPTAAYGLQVPAAEVIDGQQRLTTLQVLLAAMADAFGLLGFKDLADALKLVLRNQKPLEADHEQFKVWPTNVDRDVFLRVMTAGSAQEVLDRFPVKRRRYQRRPDPRPLIAEAYLFFHGAITDFCDVDDASRAATALYSAVLQQLQLVHIELEQGEDPQAIFEALNGRNEPLLPSDLIKNFIFRKVPTDIERTYDQYWRHFETEPAEDGGSGDDRYFWRRAQRQGRFKRSRLDLFLFHYLASQSMKEHAIGHLFRGFQDWWPTHADPTQQLADLKQHSQVFARLLVPTGDDRLAKLAARLRALDTSTVYPFLLFLLGRGADRVPADALDGILTDIESYLVRRMVCGLTTKDYNHTFMALLRGLDDGEAITRERVHAMLCASDRDLTTWPDDERLRTSWLDRPVYQELGAGKVAMVLRALNDHLHSKLDVKVEIKSALTVDHVMPQGWRKRWPAPPPGASTADEASRRRDRLLHTFGNLTLITGNLNSSLQDAAFSERRSELLSKALLKLNTWFQDKTDWGEEAILERGGALVDVARIVWPGP